MEIEVGRTYLMRNGLKVSIYNRKGIADRLFGGMVYGVKIIFNEDGCYHPDKTEHPFDIVSIYTKTKKITPAIKKVMDRYPDVKFTHTAVDDDAGRYLYTAIPEVSYKIQLYYTTERGAE